MKRTFAQGDRVQTATGQFGTVVYVRMAPPDYDTVEAVSVYLDSRRDSSTYTGTIYRPKDLRHV